MLTAYGTSCPGMYLWCRLHFTTTYYLVADSSTLLEIIVWLPAFPASLARIDYRIVCHLVFLISFISLARNLCPEGDNADIVCVSVEALMTSVWLASSVSLEYHVRLLFPVPSIARYVHLLSHPATQLSESYLLVPRDRKHLLWLSKP